MSKVIVRPPVVLVFRGELPVEFLVQIGWLPAELLKVRS